MKRHQDRARTPLPPPLIHMFCILFASVLHKFAPLPLLVDSGQNAIAITIAGSGIFLLLWSAYQFNRHKTDINYNQPSNAIITSGPYRFTRNPVYLSFALILLAIACQQNNSWLAIMVLPACVATQYLVIHHEEAYLLRRFGEQYRDYQRQVRRWL